jgi:hypothetical protein
LTDYFSHENFAKQAYAPLLTVELRDKIDVTVNVVGGGVAGQAGAVAHGIARALQKMNPELAAGPQEGRHITRDPREKGAQEARPARCPQALPVLEALKRIDSSFPKRTGFPVRFFVPVFCRDPSLCP